jgi:hypothetical protein
VGKPHSIALCIQGVSSGFQIVSSFPTHILHPNTRNNKNLNEELVNWLKNGVLWDVMPCGSCKNGRFGGT